MKLESDLEKGLFRQEVVPPDIELILRLRDHLAVIQGANHLLAEKWDTLGPQDRDLLIGLALKAAAQLSDRVDRFAQSVCAADVAALQR